MKKYFIIIPTLLIVYFLTLDFNEETVLDNNVNASEDVVNDEIKDEKSESVNSSNVVAVSYNGKNIDMNIDEYVVGVLACEMPASFNIEALKAGAIAARTFYLYKLGANASYVATTTDQCFINEEGMHNKWGNDYEKYYSIIKNAVEDTSGKIISYDGNIIESFYFSMSNGYTENIENVFSESKPYLVSVDSHWEKGLKAYEKSALFSKSEFLEKLGLESSEKLDVQIISRSESGRINELGINGVKFKGTEFRKKLGIRSTDASIEVENDNVKITTRGYGHGVGLSQYGANEMAKLGYTYEEIIKHYYSGTEISSL